MVLALVRVLSVVFAFCVAAQVTSALSLFRPCGSPSCLCFPERAVAVCARLSGRMTRVPHFRRRQVANMAGINISHQDITRLRPADFQRSTWPALQWIDLRGNTNLDCSTLEIVPAGVKVFSDCPKPGGIGLGSSTSNDNKPATHGRAKPIDYLQQPQPPLSPQNAPTIGNDDPEPEEEKAQGDGVAVSSPSSYVSLGKITPAIRTVKNTNKTKGKELVIPFKGYFKLFLPKML